VEAVDQSAVISICCVVMPTIDAADVDAPRVECAVKTEVSIPEDDRTFFSQRAIVEDTTGECGLLMPRKR